EDDGAQRSVARTRMDGAAVRRHAKSTYAHHRRVNELGGGTRGEDARERLVEASSEEPRPPRKSSGVDPASFVLRVTRPGVVVPEVDDEQVGIVVGDVVDDLESARALEAAEGDVDDLPVHLRGLRGQALLEPRGEGEIRSVRNALCFRLPDHED